MGAMAPLPQQSGTSTQAGGGLSKSRAADLDKALRDNPDAAKALAQHLSKNPDFVGPLLEQLKHNPAVMEQIDPLAGEIFDPGSPGNGRHYQPMHWACDTSNDDLLEIIRKLSNDNFVNAAVAYEKANLKTGKDIHDFRMKKIADLTSDLRLRAAR